MKLAPPRDDDGRPVIPPMEDLFPAVHEYFLEHRWSLEPHTRLVPPGEARRRWGDEPWRQFLHGRAANAGAVWTAKNNYRRKQVACSLHRRIVDFFRLHLSCDRKACRRAGACAMIDVDCYYIVQPYLKAVFYPGLRPMLREEMARRQAAGEWSLDDESDDLASPAGTLPSAERMARGRPSRRKRPRPAARQR